jgi:BirA family biotin operon repressor/biotin-[acetyl-CoA-carboxylase] ligase
MSNTLLNLLADGEFHSGEALAERLGISRTAVWKQVGRAVDNGYPIETVRGKGYRLNGGLDLLSATRIRRLLPNAVQERVQLLVLDETDSTNAEIGRSVHGWSGHKIPVCVADMQKEGRGRRGRRWHSPRGENLYLSLGLSFEGGFSILDGLSLVFGVAVAEALQALGVPNPGLKWPNDIFINGAKLGGILIELRGELEEGWVQVIAGIGMNVHMTDAADVDQNWVSLARLGGRWERNVLVAEILKHLLASVDEFQLGGFSAFRDAWQQRDIFFDRPLVATQGDVQGVGRGIDESGHYLLERPDGTVYPVRAGEVSLRVVG